MSTALKLHPSGQNSPTQRLFRFEEVNYFRSLPGQTLIHLHHFEQAVVDAKAEEIWLSLRNELPFYPFSAFDTTVYVNLDQIERYYARRSNTEFEFKDGSHLWVERDFLSFSRLIHEFHEQKNS